MTPIVTDHDKADPRISARFVDGRLEVLHISRRDPALPGFADFLTALRQELSVGLGRHLAELGVPPLGPGPDEDDPDLARALAFAESQLGDAPEVTPPRPRTWFPDQADGRDATGTVHVSVRHHEIVILEAPAEMFERPASAGGAIKVALNRALEHRERDAITLGKQRGHASTSDSPDWHALAEQVARLGRG